MLRATVNWLTSACAKRASWTASQPPLSVAHPTTSHLRYSFQEISHELPLTSKVFVMRPVFSSCCIRVGGKAKMSHNTWLFFSQNVICIKITLFSEQSKQNGTMSWQPVSYLFLSLLVTGSKSSLHLCMPLFSVLEAFWWYTQISASLPNSLQEWKHILPCFCVTGPWQILI